MKKVFFMLVMLFTMSVYSFAEDNNATEIRKIEKYDIKVNTRKLAHSLSLSSDQEEMVKDITEEFTNDMVFAALQNNDLITRNAINKNVRYMSYILNKEQYRKYLVLLNTTLNNRGIVIDNK